MKFLITFVCVCGRGMRLAAKTVNVAGAFHKKIYLILMVLINHWQHTRYGLIVFKMYVTIYYGWYI